MRSSEVFSLPIPMNDYNFVNEQIVRRSIEQYCAALRDDIQTSTDKTDKVASLALRRHQFLLMGG